MAGIFLDFWISGCLKNNSEATIRLCESCTQKCDIKFDNKLFWKTMKLSLSDKGLER